ncbi:Aldo/keto reductase [Multifurca ochricompacta]|uniref:Aldo/keto reductase n=1 Tax=Multifurca ochricompacta TaxID=376703 RepID=A0AAD4M870_9AGAM|nr:Aldo/keto reductase [Multifurca ochricompacta]
MSSLNVNRRVPYTRLGKSGLKVSRLILGCMSYGSPEWQKWILGEEEGIEQIKYAYENGIQTFDTANAYSSGLSEVILGKAIKQLNLPREEIVVLTKLHFPVSRSPAERLQGSAEDDRNGYVNQYGQSRKHIFDAVQLSLKRLQLDYVDVLQCHRFDNNTPIEEVMQALHDVVQKGWARYIGMSSCWAWQCYAINNRLTPFISMQNHYNLVYREEEREMIPTLKHFGVGSIPWSPLGRGALTRPLGERSVRADNDIWHDTYLKEPSNQEVVKRVEEIAKKHGASMAQISLAWSLTKDVVAAPIIGTTSLDKLKDLIGAVDIKLSEEEVKYLEAPYKPTAIIGHI